MGCYNSTVVSASVDEVWASSKSISPDRFLRRLDMRS